MRLGYCVMLSVRDEERRCLVDGGVFMHDKTLA